MSEFENNGVVGLCGKQREFYHVEYMCSTQGQIVL